MNNSINNSKRSCIFGIKIKDFIDSVYQLSDIDERNEIINDIHNLVKECYCMYQSIYFCIYIYIYLFIIFIYYFYLNLFS